MSTIVLPHGDHNAAGLARSLVRQRGSVHNGIAVGIRGALIGFHSTMTVHDLIEIAEVDGIEILVVLIIPVGGVVNKHTTLVGNTTIVGRALITSSGNAATCRLRRALGTILPSSSTLVVFRIAYGLVAVSQPSHLIFARNAFAGVALLGHGIQEVLHTVNLRFALRDVLGSNFVHHIIVTVVHNVIRDSLIGALPR